MKSRSWLELLPEPWSGNPHVVVVMAPNKAISRTSEALDGRVFGVLAHRGKVRGLQLLKPEIATWEETEAAFADVGLEMAQPQYIGRLEDIPQQLLMDASRATLVFLTAAMWRPYLHLKAAAAQLYIGKAN